MLAIGTGVPIFALASLCWCTRNFKLLVCCLPWVPMSQFLPLLVSAGVLHSLGFLSVADWGPSSGEHRCSQGKK